MDSFPGKLDPDFQIDGTLQSLPGMVVDCINKCDVDIRRELYNGAILAGNQSVRTFLTSFYLDKLIDRTQCN